MSSPTPPPPPLPVLGPSGYGTRVAARESTAGAWLGLLLFLYGAGSALFSGVAAIQWLLLPRFEDMMRLQIRTREAESVGTSALIDLINEQLDLVAALVAPSLTEAAVSGALALALMVASIGVCRRSNAARNVAVLLVWLKLASLAVVSWLVYDWYLPRLTEVAERLDELFGMLESQGGGQVRNPFGSLASSGALDSGVTVMLISVAVPALLALWVVHSGAVVRWCRPK